MNKLRNTIIVVVSFFSVSQLFAREVGSYHTMPGANSITVNPSVAHVDHLKLAQDIVSKARELAKEAGVVDLLKDARDQFVLAIEGISSSMKRAGKRYFSNDGLYNDLSIEKEVVETMLEGLMPGIQF